MNDKKELTILFHNAMETKNAKLCCQLSSKMCEKVVLASDRRGSNDRNGEEPGKYNQHIKGFCLHRCTYHSAFILPSWRLTEGSGSENPEIALPATY